METRGGRVHHAYGRCAPYIRNSRTIHAVPMHHHPRFCCSLGAAYAIVEARCQKSMIFCTQYQSEGWYTRIAPNPESDSPVSEAIMDRIIHNAYEVLVDGRVSMRERKGLKAAREGGGQDV